MNPISHTSLDLARMLLDLEDSHNHDLPTGEGEGSGDHIVATMKVCEKLRIVLTVFAGAYGFQSLLNRALAQAKMHNSSLAAVVVLPDGSLSGLKELSGDSRALNGPCGEILVARLLDLLFIFIGESLTLKLIRNAWPQVPPESFTTGPKE